ncbi:unnamed protein product [Adineta steineri]|uniref:PDZ domain-containing protein n=1 Tax=Adineta steineri TaxID=433720 RepID=A0A818GAD2_9BILA|nr:unnamed protein product [Adineta steineri]
MSNCYSLIESSYLIRDVLIFLNETNVIKPPVALTIDRVKSEFTALRRENKTIQIGICRCLDRSLFNNTTVQHLGSLTFHEFQNLSHNNQVNDNRKTSSFVNSESKKLLSLFSNKKKTTSTQKQKINLIKKKNTTETDDQKLISKSTQHRHIKLIEKDNSIFIQKSFDSVQQTASISIDRVNTHDEKQSKDISSYSSSDKSCRSYRSLPTKIVTDACFIYRRELIKKPDTTNAMILRGREIAYEAAHSPTIPSSMPNYSHDQIRELYGEIDKKTRRLQENQYIFHAPMIDAWSEKSPWNLSSSSSFQDQCPLPKFRLDKNDQTIFMATYLSTGLSNPRIIPNKIKINTNELDKIRGSFHTSIADRTNISPSPLLLNIRFDFNKLNPTTTNTNSFLKAIQQKISTEKQSEIIPIFNLDDIQQHSTEQSIPATNNINLIIPKSIAPLVETCETMDIDSLIDFDDQTAISYHTAKESRMEIDLDSLFSTKNNQTININPLITFDDGFNTNTSSNDNSCDYDVHASSIQSNIFSDNLFEQTETFNPVVINDNDDIYKKSSIDNLIGIVDDMNQKQSCINHLVFVYDDTIIDIDEQSKLDKNQSIEWNTDAEENTITDDKSLIQQNSDYPSEIILANTNNYHQLSFNEENNSREITDDIDEEFEELYQRYLNDLDQYQIILEQINEFQQKQHQLTPIDEEVNTINEQENLKIDNIKPYCLILPVKRQKNHIGHYGFEFEQTDDDKIMISSIIDSQYCPNLHVGDEIISINNNSTLITLEDYHLLFHSLWYNQCEYIKLTVKKAINIPIISRK